MNVMNLKHMMYQMLPVHKTPPIGLHLRYLTHVMDLIHLIHQIHDATCASDVPVATRTKMTGGTPEVRSDKSLTLMVQWTNGRNGPMDL